MTPVSLILFLALTIVLPTALALLVWPRRSAGGSRAFLSLMVSLVLWGLVVVGEFSTTELAPRLLWDNLSLTGMVLVSGIWGYFSLRILHNSLLASRPRQILAALGGAFLIGIAWSDSLHHLLRPEPYLDFSGNFPVLGFESSVIYLLFLVLASVLPLAGAVLILRGSLGEGLSSRAPLLPLLVAAIAPFTGLLLTISGVSLLTSLGPVIGGYAVSGLALGWSILRHNLLDRQSVVRESLFEHTDLGVLVLDPKSRLVQLNPAAQHLLSITRDDVLGLSIEDVLPRPNNFVALLEAAETENFEIETEIQSRLLFFEVRITELPNDFGENFRMIVFRDVSKARQAENTLRSQKQLLENLVAIARASTKVSDIQTTFQSILSITAKLTGAQVGSLFLLDREGKVTDSILARGDVPRNVRTPILNQVMDQGLAGWTVRNNRPAIIEDTHRDDRWVEVPNHPLNVRSALAIPITRGSQALGVMTLEHESPGHFSENHSTLMQAAADQIALAIRNAQIHEEQQQVNRRQVMLYKVLRSVSGHLDPATILDVALTAVSSDTEVPAIAVLMPDPVLQDLTVQASVGRHSPETGVRIPMETSSAGRAFKTGKSQMVSNIENNPDILPTNPNLTSELAVPLMSGQKITGVLSFQSDQAGFFDNEDMMLAESVADAISLALDNAALYQGTEQALEEQTLLRKAAEQISSTPDLFGGLEYLADQMVDTFRLESVSIYRFENGQQHPSLVLCTGQRSGADNNEEISGAFDQNTVDQLRSGQIVILQDGELDQEAGENDSGRMVYAPFLARGRFIGFAEMRDAIPDRVFSKAELSLLNAISQQAALALQRAQLFEDIQNARQAAEDADAAKSEFITVLAHELQGPMMSIKGFAEMLSVGSMGPINESQKNFLRVIQTTVDRMSLLVSELTDISRIESGHLSLKLENVDTSEIIQEVLAEIQAQAVQNNQDVQTRVKPDLPRVMADPSRLAQILFNLLSNAIKYTLPGGRITISAQPYEESQNYIQITVADTGIGISLEDQQYVFEKFFRTKDELARDITGTGLGLNITRHLVELQGGKIWFESRLRQGTTFHFTLPVVRAKEG